jgi:hypothetical protein
MFWTVQVGEAELGFVEVTALPTPSTATHKAVETHETPVRPFVPSMFLTLQVGEAALGFVEVASLPWASTATHRFEDAQETPVRAFVPSAVIGADHVRGELASAELEKMPIKVRPTPSAISARSGDRNGEAR